jgi:hypothetical protein
MPPRFATVAPGFPGRLHYLLLLVLLVGYPALMLLSAQFGPIDDHNFLGTLQAGKPMFSCVFPQQGRFYPLCAREYGLIALISAEPLWYHAFNALQYLLFALILRALFAELAAPDQWRWALLVLSLSPGFVSAWFRLVVAERGALFFFSLSLLAYLRHSRCRTIGSLLAAWLSATCALFYKEPGFLMLGTFAVTRLAIGFRHQEKGTRRLDLLLSCSCLGFVAVYYAVVYLHRGDHLYGAMPGSPLRLLANVIFGYLLNDPLIVCLVIPLAGWRLCRLVLRKGAAEPVADPLLFGAAVYALAFWQLRLFQPYYWLPAYGFAVPALVLLWRRTAVFATPGWRRVLAAAALLQLLNAVPQALHLVSFQAYNGRNYQQALDVLAAQISRSRGAERPVIFLAGVNRASGVELYESLAAFLLFRGIAPDRFDLRSDLPPDNPFLFAGGDRTRPFTAFHDAAPAQIGRGDYLLVTPYGRTGADAPEGEYGLVFRTRSPLAIPSLGLFPLARYVVSRAKGDADVNILAWPDYYLYRRR